MDLDHCQSNVKSQSWWWRDLSKVCGEGEGVGWFQAIIEWKVGVGDKVRFWEDAWVSSNNFKTMFLRLYSISSNQRKKVGEIGEWAESIWQWRLRWRRDMFEWENAKREKLLGALNQVILNKEVNDLQVWGGDASGQFTVKSTYGCLSNHVNGDNNEYFKQLWKVKALPNVITTACMVLLIYMCSLPKCR